MAYLATHKCLKCFGRTILFAPDEDIDTLRTSSRSLGYCEGRPPEKPTASAPITLYVSNRDKALRASQRVHGHQRAGQAGSEMIICKDVDTIDVGYFRGSDKGGHGYQVDLPVLLDAKAALEGIPPDAPFRKLKQAYSSERRVLRTPQRSKLSLNVRRFTYSFSCDVAAEVDVSGRSR